MPTVKRPIDDLIAEYKTEYRRTSGADIEVTYKGPWLYIGQSTYKRNELPTFIARLKARPTFNPPAPTTNIMGDTVIPEKLEMKPEGSWLVITRGSKFMGYIARNGWSGKTAFCQYPIGIPVLGQFLGTLSVEEMREIVHECNQFFGMGGSNASGKSDLSDAIVDEIDGALQRAGVVWPRHETSAMIRRAINNFKLGTGHGKQS